MCWLIKKNLSMLLAYCGTAVSGHGRVKLKAFKRCSTALRLSF